MATADSVKAKLQGLIAKANAATGNTDADLTSAIDALVAGFGQGGGIPGVTVLKGEYVAGAGGSYAIPSVLKVIHNLGEIRPFCFHLKSRDSHQKDAAANSIYEGIVVVSFVKEQNPTYGADAIVGAIVPRTQCCFYEFGGGVDSGSSMNVIFYDSETNDQRNYGVNMWPDGFTIGMYRAIVKNVIYDYELLYGDFYGGAV